LHRIIFDYYYYCYRAPCDKKTVLGNSLKNSVYDEPGESLTQTHQAVNQALIAQVQLPKLRKVRS